LVFRIFGAQFLPPPRRLSASPLADIHEQNNAASDCREDNVAAPPPAVIAPPSLARGTRSIAPPALWPASRVADDKRPLGRFRSAPRLDSPLPRRPGAVTRRAEAERRSGAAA
jgi:hypothetical protein